MAKAPENMPTNSRKRTMIRRMYLLGVARETTGKANAAICNEMEAMTVVIAASWTQQLRNVYAVSLMTETMMFWL